MIYYLYPNQVLTLKGRSLITLRSIRDDIALGQDSGKKRRFAGIFSSL